MVHDLETKETVNFPINEDDLETTLKESYGFDIQSLWDPKSKSKKKDQAIEIDEVRRSSEVLYANLKAAQCTLDLDRGLTWVETKQNDLFSDPPFSAEGFSNLSPTPTQGVLNAIHRNDWESAAELIASGDTENRQLFLAGLAANIRDQLLTIDSIGLVKMLDLYAQTAQTQDYDDWKLRLVFRDMLSHLGSWVLAGEFSNQLLDQLLAPVSDSQNPYFQAACAEALARDHSNPWAVLSVEMNSGTSNFERALPLAQEAQKKLPHDIRILRILALAEQDAEIEMELRQRILKSPLANSHDFSAAGYLAGKLKRLTLTKEIFSLAKERFPSDEAVSRHAGWAFVNLEDSEEALRWFAETKELAKDPDADTTLLAGLAIAYFGCNDRSQAMSSYQRLIRAGLSKEPAENWVDFTTIQAMGWTEVEKQQLDEVRIATLTSNYKSSPNNPKALRNYLHACDNREQQLEILLLITELEDSSALEFAQAIKLAAEQRKLELFTRLITSANAKWPEDQQVKSTAKWGTLALGDGQRAVVAFRAALLDQADPDSETETLAGLAAAHWIANDKEAAILIYKELIEKTELEESDDDWTTAEPFSGPHWSNFETKLIDEVRQATLRKFPALK